MIRGFATKLSRIARTTKTQFSFSLYNSPLHFPSPQSRFFSTNQEFKVNPVSIQIINYAFSLARSLKTDDSYAQGLLVLEQCESNQTDNASKGLVLLAMSKLLSERGNYDDAMEKILKINELKKDLLSTDEKILSGVNEALTVLQLEMGEDDSAASVGVDAYLLRCDASEEELGYTITLKDPCMLALKGLVELVCGDPESAESYFKEAQDSISYSGNAALSYAEFLHTMRNFSSAKELYQKIIQGVPENDEIRDPDNLTAANMAILPWAVDVSLAATCALGQLEAHMGNFADSEEILTQALTKTEEQYGSHHPKVGVVLTCIALMHRYKPNYFRERSKSFLKIQEGLYRRAIEVLKAPPLETAVDETKPYRRDVIALARGGYAHILSVQGKNWAHSLVMRSWAANSAWRNRRLQFAEALSVPASKVPVIDVRISRVL